MTDQEAAAWTRGHAVGMKELKVAEKEWQVERAELKAEVDALKRRLGQHDACNGVMGESGYVPECISLRAEVEKLREALRLAEAALADIGDADREPGDDLAWCERRAAEPLPIVRAALKEPK